MAKEDRKVLHAPTDAELATKIARGQEIALHKMFESWCTRNNVPYIHSRTDRKSTIQVGHPDFTLLLDDHGCCIEFKAPGGKLTEEQGARIAQLTAARVPVLVTDDYDEAVKFAIKSIGAGRLIDTLRSPSSRPGE